MNKLKILPYSNNTMTSTEDLDANIKLCKMKPFKHLDK